MAAVMPTVSESTNELEWILTPEFSPFVDDSVWDEMEVKWELDDPLLV